MIHILIINEYASKSMESKLLKHELNSYYKEIITSMLHKQIKIVYKRKSADKKDKNSVDIIHAMHGKVLKTRKHSFLLQLNNPYIENNILKYKKLSIGYRNIIGEPVLIKH